MPTTQSSSDASTPRSGRNGWLLRAPLVYVVVAVSLGALAPILFPRAWPSFEPEASEPTQAGVTGKSPGRVAPAESENTAEPAPPPAESEPAPALAVLVEPAPAEVVAAPEAPDPSELVLSIAERREAEEERRQEAANEAPPDRAPSPQLIDTPAEAAAMNALAAQRELERKRWAEEEEARPRR